MGKKDKAKPCVVCKGDSRKGLNACGEHVHVASLQQALVAAQSVQGPGFQFLLGYEPFKELAMLLAKAHFGAVASNGSSMALASGRARLGPEDSDGILMLGDHIALPRYAVPQRRQTGVLAETLRAISDCVRAVEGELDALKPPRVDTSVRCGLTACPGRNRRQNPSVRFCGYCGRSFVVEEEMAV